MRIRYTLLMLAFVVLLGATVGPAAASPEKDREVDQLREQIHSLLKQADELRAEGKHDAARERVRKAEQIERRLAEYFTKEQRKDYSDADLKKILLGLEHGIGSLKALGKNDLAEALQRVAKEVRGKRETPHEEPVNREREAAEHQIEVMRMAMKAFLEKDQHDAAERVEYAIHALELALAGRRDKEANQIREKAPKRAELAKLMAQAGKIYREFRMLERAEKVEELGRRFAGQAERRRPQRERAERERTERERGEKREAGHGDRRVAELQAQLAEIAEMMKHLQKELQAMKREMK